MKFYILIITMFTFSFLKSQENDSIVFYKEDNNKSNLIKLEIVQYLINKGDLDSTSDLLKLYNNKIFTTSLIDNKILDSKNKGIFRIVTTVSHSHRYLLLFDENIKIINYKDLEKTFQSVLNFLKHNNESKENIQKYLEKIIEEYIMEKNRLR